MSASTPSSKPPPAASARPNAVDAMHDVRRQLAVVEHARRQAIYDARDAHGDRPTPVIPPPPRVPTFPAPRGELPTLDELTGPAAPRARWRLVLALAAALGGLGELARQVAGLFTHGK